MAKKKYNKNDHKLKDMTGLQFGRLFVIKRDYSVTSTNDAYWICQCDCGNETSVRGNSLRAGDSTSCGCYLRDRVNTHRMTKTQEYNSWRGMVDRMTNPNHSAFHHYGGRGLELHEQYRNFSNFYADLGPKPGPKYSIGRIDNNLGYVPGNLRWETQKQQTNNTRQNIIVSFMDKTQTLTQWTEELGMKRGVLWNRIKRYGWPIERALTEPVNLRSFGNQRRG